MVREDTTTTVGKEATANVNAQKNQVPSCTERPHEGRCLPWQKDRFRYTKRGGQVWIKIFPDKPVSKKALGVRMGSGKGAPEYWVAVVKNQKVMFEIGGVSEEEAREALRLAQHKLPIKTKIIAREAPETENGGE